MSKNCQKLSFFKRKMPLAIFFEKTTIFGNLKKIEVKFLAIFLH